MVRETRKQREIRQREAKILAVAQDHLLHGGYLGLNMDRIAADMEYSKGTIYQHFRNKEEIVLALANRALETRTTMFERAAQWPGPTRQRLAAIGAAGQAFVEQFPHHFIVEQIIRASSIWEKTSAERREVMRRAEIRCMTIVGGIVHDAVAAGDLRLPAEVAPEDLVCGCWSMNWGAQIIFTTSESLDHIGIRDPVLALWRNMNALLDGFGWRPLSTEFDYITHITRVKAELFASEAVAVPAVVAAL